MKEKVAIYCRLSEEDKNKQNATDDSGSIQNQKAMLREYAEHMEWEIYDIYSDDDYAGSDRNRPEFKRLIVDAQARKFDIILCKTQSRFTREVELVERYIHGLFPIWGIRFVSIVDNADTANKGNKKSRQINALVNEWYLEEMSESIKAALSSRRKNGFHIGSFALYGYKKDPDQKGHLIIDEEAAAVVREVFTLFSEGYGKTAIARILNDRGIPNPSEYKRLQGLRYKRAPGSTGTLWKYFAISDMLTNEIYIGNMVQGKTEKISYKGGKSRTRPKDQWFVVEGTHEPIIDLDLWDRVQKRIAEHTKPFTSGMVGIFSKKARCAYCGYVLRSSKSGGRRFLGCPNRHISKNVCQGAFISEEKLERSVIAELNRLSAEYLDMDELERKVNLNQALEKQRQEAKAELAAHQKMIADIAKQKLASYEDKMSGIISTVEYIEFAKRCTVKIEGLEAQIPVLEEQIEQIEKMIASGKSKRKILEQYVKVEHLTHEMVEILIDKILVGKRIEGTRNVPIEIHWNF